jgi:integrase
LLSGWGRHSSRSFGKGSKSREVLIPAVIATRLFANRGNAPASATVFRSVRQPGYPLTERAVNFIVKEAGERAGVNPAASIHWLRHAHTSHAIDNGRCGRQATLSEGGQVQSFNGVHLGVPLYHHIAVAVAAVAKMPALCQGTKPLTR